MEFSLWGKSNSLVPGNSPALATRSQFPLRTRQQPALVLRSSRTQLSIASCICAARHALPIGAVACLSNRGRSPARSRNVQLQRKASGAAHTFTLTLGQKSASWLRGKPSSWQPCRPGRGSALIPRAFGEEVDTPKKKAMLFTAMFYLVTMVVVPFMVIWIEAFQEGMGPMLNILSDPYFMHSLSLTLTVSAIALPVNTAFGIQMALLMARNNFRGKWMLKTLLDAPATVSPIVLGLMLVLLYGNRGWFTPVLDYFNVNVAFEFPGILFATLFVTMPFVVRELTPLLEAQDPSEEEAARTLGADEADVFWNVTLPYIKTKLFYGMIMTNARALGEFGAVSIISGNIIGKTQTVSLFIEATYKEYDTQGAFCAALVVSFFSSSGIFLKHYIEKWGAPPK